MTAFADSLVQDETDYRPGSIDSNPFLQGRGQLRPYATYTFQAPLAPVPVALPRNISSGTFTKALFNPLASARARPAAWLATAVAERVSPNGDVLQERDPLGVRSVAKYGYGYAPGTAQNSTHVLPYLQAHHTEASTVLFESFESIYNGSRGEDQFALLSAEITLPASSPSVPPAPAHTGVASIVLKPLPGATPATYQLTLKPVPLTTQLVDEGLLVKCWLYLPNFSFAYPIEVGTLEVWPVNGTSALRTAPLNIVAQTGAWCLVEAQLPLALAGQNTLTAGATLIPRLRIQLTDVPNPPTTVRVDDVRMQPGKAQMTAYVYDPSTFRLLATFDDQHYALLYQYNSQGQLIRKQAETVRGVKTLQETFYHTPLQPKPTP